MAREAGLDAVDLSIAWVPDWQAAAVASQRREIEDAGMSVAMVTCYSDFTHPDPAHRQRELEQTVRIADVAAGLGARLLRVTAGQAYPETPRTEGIAWAVEGLTRLVEMTRGSGVTLVYENHAKPFVWQYTDFCTQPDIFVEIVQKTQASGLGLNFDTANAAAFAEDPLALLDQVIDRVVSVHAADTATRGALKMVLLGTGIAPIPGAFSRLKRAGFDGWVCIEEGSFQGEAGVRAATRYVRQTWAKA
jgi:sugar phosphate isomerase/epimerase